MQKVCKTEKYVFKKQTTFFNITMLIETDGMTDNW